MIAALVIALCAAINRLAGGGWPVNVVQGSPLRFAFGRYQSALYIALAALLLHDWQIAMAFGVGFWFWRLFGWGHLISLGRPSGATARPANGLDKMLMLAVGAHAGLAIRMGAFVFPALYAVGMMAGSPWLSALCVPFGILAMLAYEFWWRVKPDPIGPAEITVGALYGALIVVA